MDINLALNFLIAMLAIVNPVGKIPVWLEASKDQADEAQWRLALLVTATAGGVLLASLWAGSWILELFSIDLASFRIAGGIVILVTGLAMLRGQATDVDTTKAADKDDPMEQAEARFRSIVVPMAIPIIAGPGSITTAIVFSSRAESWISLVILSAVLAGILMGIYGTLLVAPRVRQYVSDVGLTIITRLFGLLLIGIAVQLIVIGLGEIFPVLLQGGDSPIRDDLNNGKAGG